MTGSSTVDEIDYRRTLEFAVGVPFSDGNDVNILQNGDEIFPAMLAAVHAAKHTINFVTYVYWRGDIADEFAHALSERAKAGVKVRVLLDSFGSKKIRPNLLSDFDLAGVEVRWFRPLSTLRVWRSDKRTHRKILICDNKIGFSGGVGIADQWTGAARNPDEWRDIHFELRGPVLLSLRSAVLDNWNEAGDWLYEEPSDNVCNSTGSIPIQLVRSSSTIGWTDIAELMRTLIRMASERLIFISAYFAPDQQMVDLLCESAARGVDVRILTAGQHSDSRLSQLAGQKSYQALLNAGVKLFLYQKTLLHTKLILVDREVSCFGSANTNHRSLSKDEECSLVALSDELNTALYDSFSSDCADALELDAVGWQRRGKTEQVREALAGLLLEQL